MDFANLHFGFETVRWIVVTAIGIYAWIVGRQSASNKEMLDLRIWRQKAKFEDLMAKAREHEQMASVLVAELGEKPDEKAGALLVQSITTLATHAALAAQGEDPDIETVRKLARAARDVIQTRQVDRKDRQAIREEARRELLEEQKAALKNMEAKPGESAEAMTEIRRVLGIG